MKRNGSFGAGGVVARSLKMTRSTHLLIAAITSAVAINVMVAIQFVGWAAQMALVAVVFGTVALATSAVAADLFARSGQAVANLRSIGANLRSLSWAVLAVIIVWGIVGALVGAAAGAGLGMAAGGSPGSGSLVTDFAFVVGASVAAMAAGVYAGARAYWRS